MYTYHRLAAGEADVERARRLLAVFGAAFNDAARYDADGPAGAYLRRVLGQEHVIVVVACAGDDVVGGLAAYVLEKLESDCREIYLYDLAVSEDHRRRGIARALIETLCNIAREVDAYVVFVQADPEDAPAIALYASLGVREEVHHFDITVERSPRFSATRRAGESR